MNATESGCDIFFSYARADNRGGNITRLVAAIEEDYVRFFPGKRLNCFFDTQAIENGEDWRNRLYTSLKRSWVMVSFLSASYLASPWCRREWQAWCDIERSRGWLSYMLQPIYYVEVPDGEDRIEEFLRHRNRFAEEIDGYMRGAASGTAMEERFEENECLAEVLSRQIVDLKPWHSDGENALRREEIRARLEGLVRSLDKKITLAVRGEQSPTNIPRHNQQFCGRIHELKSIRQSFAEGEKGLVPVLHGMGGEGKTSLAFAYAHAFAYDYPGGRRHVLCAGLTDLAQCFIKLGEECGLDLPPDNSSNPALAESAKAARFGAVWDWLADRPQGRVLVILDTIDTPGLFSTASLVNHIRPTDMVHVLATTRCDVQRAGGGACRIEVRGLPLRDGIALLESFRPAEEEERSELRRLVVLLGGHALSLELAGAFLRSNQQMGWKEYVDIMAADLLPGLDETLGEAASLIPYAGSRLQQVSQLVAPVLEQLSPLDHQALLLAALLAPEEIVEPWIREALSRLHPDAMRKKALVDPWTRLKRTLAGLCLWQQDETEGVFRMHRLVREVVRRRFLEEQGIAGGESAGLAKLSEYVELLQAVGHEATLAYVEGRGAGPEGSGWKFHQFAALPPTIRGWFEEKSWAERTLALPVPLYHYILRWAGRTEEGLALVQKGLSIATGLRDRNERDRRTASYNMLLGHLQRARGDLEAARAAYARALALLEDAFGASSSPADSQAAVIERVHCLDYAGALETAGGDTASGRAFHRRALEMLDRLEEGEALRRRERAYTLDHLACTFDIEDQKQRDEAFVLFTESLDIRAALLEAEPNNARALRDYSVSLDFIGDCLSAGDDSAGAMDCYARSLAVTEKLCTLDPPSLAFLRDRSVSLNKVGDMHLTRGNHAAALERYQQALAIRRDLTLVDKENKTLWHDRSVSNLRVGDALTALGQDPSGHYQDALRIRRNLSAAQPANVAYARGLALCLEKIAAAKDGAGAFAPAES